MVQTFEADHQRLFGFTTPEKGLVADTVLVEATAAGEPLAEPEITARPMPAPLGFSQLTASGRTHEAPVYDREALGAGAEVPGPAILKEAIATIIVEPGWGAKITAQNHCILNRVAPREDAVIADASRPDPVFLELFANLFMAIAEQAGAVLRNTAQSVNIKERLDFSCAIFDAEGSLVANAPHVPVHLGAMGASVRHVLRLRGDRLRPGDAVALNNPYAGGTHLPDITVITPVFDEAGAEIRFFTACRGHHADVGGLTPGSTPPFSKILEEEGVVIDNLLLLSGGMFQEQAFRDVLTSAKYPARNPDQNVADIKAQIAANETAAQALGQIVARYGWSVVRAYMGHVMDNAEAATRTAIKQLKNAQFNYTMDDGAPLKISLKINHEDASAIVDFSGTGAAGPNNFNAPRAVTTAAVLYAFRCLAGTELPLNEGCLKPLTIIVPEGSFLSPPPGSAVVAGNTEVSQAVTVALLGAMGVCASAQATMNNFLFGNATHQYYETICGGAGAGPGFSGCSAVHTHMTNTRITDPEVMELRHPVRVEAFSIRRGSGGQGKFRGGDGVIRKIRFLEPMTATITASRRTAPPFGLEGGAPGACGEQYVERADGTLELQPGRAEVELAAGDAFIIATPGGGGYGTP
jgi:5-oxoprolinase (ATP-hydrolysing)